MIDNTINFNNVFTNNELIETIHLYSMLGCIVQVVYIPQYKIVLHFSTLPN